MKLKTELVGKLEVEVSSGITQSMALYSVYWVQ